MSKNKFSFLRIIFFISIVTAFVGVILSFGKITNNPFVAGRQLSDSYNVSICGVTKVIIDHNQSCISFIDKNDTIIRTVSFSDRTYMKKVASVSINDECVYVLGWKKLGKDKQNYECIVKYSFDGEFLGIAYEVNADENFHGSSEILWEIDAYDKELYAFWQDYENKKVKLTKIIDGKSEIVKEFECNLQNYYYEFD